jgi:mRNA-degrading endonuclease YafQ of YafQ-DinJ toxin-antitoxin module
MKYRFRATRTFWRSFGKLPIQQQRTAREAFTIFKENPFDPRLRSHKIHKLSARYGRIIYSAEMEADLRVVFYVEGNTVVTVDIGSHDLYRG